MSPKVRRRRQRLVLPILAVLAAIAGYLALRHRGHPPAPLPLPRACPLGTTTAGIDVSYYQGDIAWGRVHRAGVRFAFIRVADGSTLADSKFDDNWVGAQRAHVLRGAYQYFRPDESPIDQADLVIRTLRARGAGELPPVIDVEISAGLPLATVAERAKAWIDHVRDELHVEPLVYTNPGMWGLRPSGAAELGGQPLWLAHYTQECPTVPRPWSHWTSWQYTDNGAVDGIDGPVDLDVFDGEM